MHANVGTHASMVSEERCFRVKRSSRMIQLLNFLQITRGWRLLVANYVRERSDPQEVHCPDLEIPLSNTSCLQFPYRMISSLQHCFNLLFTLETFSAKSGDGKGSVRGEAQKCFNFLQLHAISLTKLLFPTFKLQLYSKRTPSILLIIQMPLKEPETKSSY